MKKLVIIMFCVSITCLAQDTTIYRNQVKISNLEFLAIMDSVISHTNECVFVNEVPYYISVSKEYWDGLECYNFITEPLNYSVLHSYEELFPKQKLYPFHYKSCLFVFLFADSIVTISTKIDTVVANNSAWIQYLYMPDKDHPSKLSPLRSIDLYSAETLQFYRRIPCTNVKKAKRVIDTPHTKLFMD